MRAFSRFAAGYLAPARCRWRPCHESAAYLASVCTRRRIRLQRAAFRDFLRQRWTVRACSPRLYFPLALGHV